MPTLNDLAAEIIRTTAVMGAATTVLAGTPIADDLSVLITALRASADTLAVAIALHPSLAPEDGQLNTNPPEGENS